MKATELERLDRSYASTMDTVVDLEKQSMRLNQNLESYLIQVQETKKANKNGGQKVSSAVHDLDAF